MTTIYEVRVAQYACDDGIAEWYTQQFANAAEAQKYVDRLDDYEEYELRIRKPVDPDEIPF